MQPIVNDLSIFEAAKYYTSIGIIVHPLHGHKAKVQSPGKQPILNSWQKKTEPYSPQEMQSHFKADCNVGGVCGRASDLTVFDQDYEIKGITQDLFQGIDQSKFVTQDRTEKNGKKHLLFKYTPELKTGQHQALGFDIINDRGNIVLAPSIHVEGDIYRLQGPIEDRPEMPSELVSRINVIISLYNGFKEVLKRCRTAWRRLWKAIFEEKSSGKYREVGIFRGSEGRLRCLGLFAELMANGATEDHILLACKLIFENDFNKDRSLKEISYIDPKATWKNETIFSDEYLSEYLGKEITEPEIGETGTWRPINGFLGKEITEPEIGKNETWRQNNEAVYKELTEDEIKLLGKRFAERRIKIKFPEDHFISEFVTYADGVTDSYYEFKLLVALWLLSSCTQGKVFIDLASHPRGLPINIWITLIGQSSLSRKSTIAGIAREIMSFATGKALIDSDGSLEGYLEWLSNEPVQFCINDECSVTLAKMGQKYNAGYFEFECKIYDGGSHEKRLASGGKKETKAYTINNPFVTKLNATTFVKFARSITVPDFDSGYGFRFLFSAPLYDRELRNEHIRTEEDRDRLAKICARTGKFFDLFAMSSRFSMNIDDDAMSYYNNVNNEFYAYIKKAPANRELMGSAWARYAPIILKIAALIEIGKAKVSTTITLESVKLAASMVTEYFLPTLCDVYGLLTADVKNNKIDLIVSELKKLNGVGKHSVLLRKVKLSRAEFNTYIQTMHESGQIEIVINKSSNGINSRTYILKDLDAVEFHVTQVEPVPQVPQVSQIPMFLDAKSSKGIGELVNNIEECHYMCTEALLSQSKSYYQLSSSEENNCIVEQRNLRNLDIGGIGIESEEVCEKYSDSTQTTLIKLSSYSNVVVSTDSEISETHVEEEGQ